MKLGVIIPAAGKSTRFGEKDKLAEDLGGRAMLLRTVEFFTKRDEVQEIVVAAPPSTFSEFKDKFGPSLAFHGVAIVKGSDDSRSKTVQNALSHISTEVDFIAIHDAARPVLENALFEKLLIACTQLDAVIPAIPLTSTIKKIGSNECTIGDEDAIADSILGESTQATVKAMQIDSTQDRSTLWEAQTPQIFKSSLIRRAYEQQDLDGCTDDAQVVENLGEPIHLIEGDSRNIKVTTYSDLKLVKAILGIRESKSPSPHHRF